MYLFIRGRLREVINTGGFKVYPADVEAAGAIASAEQLILWVKSELGSVKAPKRIWFVDHLARNAAGKVSRAGVRASLAASA